MRKGAIKRFAFPNFVGMLFSGPGSPACLSLLPFLFFGTIAPLDFRPPFVLPSFTAGFSPASILEPLFYLVSALVVLSFAVGVTRFVRAMRAAGVEGKILPALAPTLIEIVAHRRFAKCTANKDRQWGHLLTLFGFVGLAITGTLVGIGTMLDLMHTPLPFLSGWKLFANLSAGVVLVGTVLLIGDRMRSHEKWDDTTYFDGFFIVVLGGVVATGILSELLRLAQTPGLMYSVYFIHLVLIFSLFLYAPYSKFAHIVYRTVAMAATQGKPRSAGAPVAQLTHA